MVLMGLLISATTFLVVVFGYAWFVIGLARRAKSNGFFLPRPSDYTCLRRSSFCRVPCTSDSSVFWGSLRICQVVYSFVDGAVTLTCGHGMVRKS